MKKAALVFSGGALRGFAQFGALRAIERYLNKNNIEVELVVGTSFGAITASFLAAGYNAEQMIEFSKESGLRLSGIGDIRPFGEGFLKGNRIKNLIHKKLESRSFRDMKIDLIINTLDIKSKKEFIFTKEGLASLDGKKIIRKDFSVAEAITASTAVPVVFCPCKLCDMMLMDPGVIHPVGLDFALKHRNRFDVIIVVDVSMANVDFMAQQKSVSRLNILGQYISIIQQDNLVKNIYPKMHKHPNVIVICPPVYPVRSRNKVELENLINIGYTSAKKVLKI